MDCLLTAHRATAAARRFLTQASRRHGVPTTLTIDGREAKEAGIKRDNAAHGTGSIIRQLTYWHTVVEQAQRAVKRVTRPMLGCTAFDAAQATLAGIALMHRRKTWPRVVEAGAKGLPAADHFSMLAAESLTQTAAAAPSAPPEQNLQHNQCCR